MCSTPSKAEANAFQARLQEQRYSQLVEDKAISGQDYDNARAAVRQTNAEVAANKAAVERAKLNLGYATVTAPISGRIGRALVTEGALVGQNEATPLVLMGYFNPIHHYGVPAFIADAKAAGVDGLIVVDMPPEHNSELCDPAQAAGLDFIRLTTPTDRKSVV